MKKLLTAFLSCILACSILAGCAPATSASTGGGSSQPADEGTTYDVRLVMYGEMSQRMADFCENELKEKVKEAINVNLKVEYLPWSECAGGKTELMLSSGEKFVTYTDTAFLSKCVSKGYYADLTDVATKYAPNLFEYCGGQEMFDCFSVDGRVYALPFGNKPNAGENYVLMARDDLMAQYGIEDIKTKEDLENFFTKATEDDPQYIGWSAFAPETLFGLLDTEKNIYRPNNFIMLDGNKADDDTVYDFYASEEYKQLCGITAEWVKKGLIPSDILSNPQQPVSMLQNGYGLFNQGASYRIFEYMAVIRNSVQDATLKNFYLGDAEKKPLMSRGTYSTAFAVSAAVEGEELEAYVKLIDLLQSSQEWVDFITYGVEGKDYTLNEDGSVTQLNSDVLFESWLTDNINFKRYPDYVTQEMKETYENWNEGCILQKDIGFAFDMEPVKTEYAQLQAVESEFIKPITYGFVDYDSNIDEALEKLKEAGIEKFIAEYERQFTEFMNNK